MLKLIKTILYRALSRDNYLRLLQRSYFAMYRLGLLRCSAEFKYHYFVKRLIHRGDVIIDIGANLGYFSILFARWTGPSGRVIAVEPVTAFNNIFREKARRYPQITLHSCALGTENKEIELVSTLDANYMRTGLFHVFQSDKDGRAEDFSFRFKAEMKKASELFADIQRIDYLKIDVEGFESVILNDMKDVLRRCRPIIQAEIWDSHRDEVCTLLGSIGYSPYILKHNDLVAADDLKDYDGDIIFKCEK